MILLCILSMVYKNIKIIQTIRLMQKKDDELDFLFKRISVKVNKSPDDFQPFIRILKENWYDSPSSLIGLTDGDYQKMKIPHRVVTAIRQQLASEESNIKTNQKTLDMQTISEQKKQKNQGMMSQHQLSWLVNSLVTKLMNKYNKNKNMINPILEIIKKIISNIAKDPYQMKFRTLKKSNQKINKNIVQNPECIEFMTAIGFENNQQTLQMNIVEVPHLLFLQEYLEDLMSGQGNEAQRSKNTSQNTQNTERMFLNITQFPKNQSQITSQFSQQKLSEMKYVDALDKLIQFRNKIMANPPTDRRIRIYHKKYEKKNVNIQQVNFYEEFQKSDDKIIAGYWKQAMANNMKSQKFQSKRKLEFEFLIKQKVHKQALIKIKLPNQLIIEGYFGPLQTLQTVFDVVSKIVIGDLYLFTAPPLKRMDGKYLKMTLIELESVPMGSFYLGINSNYYIEQQYVPLIEK